MNSNEPRQIRFYNGTNHPIRMFRPQDCSLTRDGKYILNPSLAGLVHPVKILPQQTPLSVRTGLLAGGSIGGDSYFLPDIYAASMDGLPDFWAYDTIIVSSAYGELARQGFSSSNPELVDRLFTPVPVFSQDPRRDGARKVGVVGFKKVCLFRSIFDYDQMLRQGRKPSLSALSVLLNWYSTFSRPANQNEAAVLAWLNAWLAGQCGGMVGAVG